MHRELLKPYWSSSSVSWSIYLSLAGRPLPITSLTRLLQISMPSSTQPCQRGCRPPPSTSPSVCSKSSSIFCPKPISCNANPSFGDGIGSLLLRRSQNRCPIPHLAKLILPHALLSLTD